MMVGQETAPSQRFLTAGALPAAAIPPRHAMRNSMASPFASEIVKQVRVHHGHQATGISPTKKRGFDQGGIPHGLKKLGLNKTKKHVVFSNWE